MLTGIGASGLVAKNFSWKLMKIGLNAVAEQDMHALLATVQAMEPEDLLVALSYSGERREINLAADEALRVARAFSPSPVLRRTRCNSARRSASIPSPKSRRRAARLSPPPPPR